jgi:hypothetical protein
MSNRKYFIYALRNKFTGEIGYIGQTNNIAKRFKEHLAQMNSDGNVSDISRKIGWGGRLCNPRKIFWIYSNKDNIEIIELESGILSERDANERESFFILKFSKEGHPLTNVSAPLIFDRLKFNRWSSSEALQRYPGGYSIASRDFFDFLSVGKFLFSRDVFFDVYQMYVEGNCQFEELKLVYDEMIKAKESAINSANGIVNLSISCSGRISENEYFDEEMLADLGTRSTFRNRCSSIYSREENKFSWNNNCLNLCAISVATSGKFQCRKRAVFYNVKSDLNILSLELWVLALGKINKEKQELMLSQGFAKRCNKTKRRLSDFDRIYNDLVKLKETFELNQIHIENYIIKLSLELIHKLGVTPEEFIFK